MSNEYASPIIEQQILVCSLQTENPKVRAYIRRETVTDDFGTPVGREVCTRIDALLRSGKVVGGAIEFSQDPALSPEAQNFIRVTPGRRDEARRFTLDQVKSLVSTLKSYRNKRLFSNAVVEVGSLASKPIDDETLQKMMSVFEDTLIAARQDLGQQPMSHIGQGRPDEDIEAILTDLLTYTPGSFISTGLSMLDKVLTGYERGNLVTISAPSGGGKSTLAMVTGINQYRYDNKNVAFVSMEMTEQELWRRVLSNISGVRHDLIRAPKDMPQRDADTLRQAWRAFHQIGKDNGCRFTVWDVKDAMFTPQKMESYIAPMMYDVIIIDYVTLFHSGRLEKWEMQLEYSRYLKSLAKKLGCVIVLLTQLSDNDKIKYGRGILENTDYWINWRWRETEEQLTGDVELRLEKARHAKARRIMAKFDLDAMQITTPIVDAASTLVTAASKQDAAEQSREATAGQVWGY